jgi:hypothetical protein
MTYADGDAGAHVTVPQDPDLEFVTGGHWTHSSEAERNSYLYGLGNMVELQQALADDPDSIRKMNDVLVQGLSSMDLAGVKKALDDWYAEHPEDSKRPVLSVLYHEIALPRVAGKKLGKKPGKK